MIIVEEIDKVIVYIVFYDDVLIEEILFFFLVQEFCMQRGGYYFLCWIMMLKDFLKIGELSDFVFVDSKIMF